MSRHILKKNAMRILSLFFTLAIVFSSMPDTKASASTVTISKTSATIQVGDTLQLKVYLNGTETSATGWGSSETSVASVDTTGKVTGKAKGSATITAFVNGETVECLVSVVKKSSTGTLRYNVLILDTSGSVKGTPLAREKEAAKRFCKTILSSSGTNYIAVLAMNSKSTQLCGFSSNYSTISAKIDGASAAGDTNINAAIAAAGSMLDSVSASGSSVIKNIVLCSDGLPTTGTFSSSGRYTSANHSKYYKYANSAYKTDVKYKNKGYFVYALGFFHKCTGKDLVFGKQLMKDLASKDKYYVITDTDDLDDALDDIAESITKTTINKTSASISIGETLQLNTYVDGVSKSAKWKTSNSAVATVNSNGLVTGKKAGTCTITATCNGKTVTCKVTVKAAVSITLNKSSITVYKNCTYKLTATVKSSSKTPTWSSSDKSIATVSNKGVVTGKKAGTCTITAKVAGKTATCKVTVKNPTISLNKKSLTLYVGNTYKLKATVGGSNSTVTWSSSVKRIATVKAGKITAKAPGTCVITAKANGVTAKCKVRVLPKTGKWATGITESTDEQAFTYTAPVDGTFTCEVEMYTDGCWYNDSYVNYTTSSMDYLVYIKLYVNDQLKTTGRSYKKRGEYKATYTCKKGDKIRFVVYDGVGWKTPYRIRVVFN